MVRHLRTTFNTDAERYHAARPRYPAALFERLVRGTGLKKNARLLEIGPGTGQATMALATRGYTITAIELGDNLARKARGVLADFPNVQIITGAYEAVPLMDEAYDLVYSATAFHWIQPEVKFTKTHRILVPHGHLAIIHTEHVSDEKGDAFFWASKPVYKQYTTALDKIDLPLPSMSSLTRPILDESLFAFKDFSVFPLVVSYTAHEYSELLATYSPTIALDAARRQAFLSGIEDLINTQFDGRIDKHFAMTLTLAQRLP